MFNGSIVGVVMLSKCSRFFMASSGAGRREASAGKLLSFEAYGSDYIR